jgi:predicted amidophosphoribosyltransferase
MSASPSRCPRCGYVLRYSRTGYSCDFCGLKGNRSASSIIASLDRSLRRRVQYFFEPRRTVVYNQPVQRSFQSCIFCGQNIPLGSLTCPVCRRPQTLGLSDQDRRVFDYITAHDGTISISNAALDLSMSIDQLTASIEHLKATGVLRQE